MHGNLRRFLPGGADRTVLSVEPGATVDTLLARLGAHRDTAFVAVNGAMAERERVLHPDDMVDCFEPVAAG